MNPKIVLFISLSLLTVNLTTAATPGLPFTEDFSSDNLINKVETSADINTEEHAVRLAWAQRKFGVFINPPVFNISEDRESRNSIAVGDRY